VPAAAEQAAPVWRPLPGPQSAAFASVADQIGYGGAAGGGKTDLMLGLAGLRHRRSLILRRLFPSLSGMVDRSREIFNAASGDRARDSYNEGLHRWRLSGERMIQFGNIQFDRDWEKYRGNPYDLHGFDEATEFSELVVRQLVAWNRTSAAGQRCQVVLTFNPPATEQGRWVIRYFLPWMAYLYPDLPECKGYAGTPAQPGELRYYTTIDGEDQEVPAGTPKAKSRTFFPASVEDNPIYMAQGYDATLEALPEPLRSQLRYGAFAAGIKADPWQVIPSDWVRAAQARGAARAGEPLPPLLSAAQDVARGGDDSTVMARLYGDIVVLDVLPGSATPDGPSAAQLILPYAGALCGLFVDVIGVGASAYDMLAQQRVRVTAINNAEAAPRWARDRSGKLTFRNLRAASYWGLREALDPAYGATLALPDDEQLYYDLTAPRWSLTTAGILIESKDDIKKRLGRSPDRGDAVVMAHWGATQAGTAGI
jgi:hypothetical protein